MKRNFIKSSNLHTVGYDSVSNVLEVEFKTGSIYQYFDVSELIYEQLIHASSAGRYFIRYIAHSFRYRLLQSNSYSEYSTRIENPVPPIDINRLYRKLALRFHPDLVTGDEGIMKEINNLYSERNFHGLQSIALRYIVH